MTDSEAVAARTNMVERQLRPSQVRDSRILNAMLNIPRESFVPGNKHGVAYADGLIEIVRGRYLLSPMVFARMAQEAQIGPADRVLDLGCLTGYSTAVIARLAQEVVAIDSDPEMIGRATEALGALGALNTQAVCVLDLAAGYAESAPYDVILCEGAVDYVPDALTAQLADGGRLVAIVRRTPALGQAMLYLRSADVVSGRPLFEATVPVLPGFVMAVGFEFA